MRRYGELSRGAERPSCPTPSGPLAYIATSTGSENVTWLWSRKGSASAALVNAQHELAFCMRRVRHEGRDPDRDSLAAAWRDEIWGLRVVVSPPGAAEFWF
jgi:hypothetical protein